MIAIIVASPYYVETVTDKETGAKSTVSHRLSEATMLYNGRYTGRLDWLNLVSDAIPPKHNKAVDVLWFDDTADERAALAEIKTKYIVLAANKAAPGVVPSAWEEKETIAALKTKLAAAGVPMVGVTNTVRAVREKALAYWRENAKAGEAIRVA